ncbi:hypothetical protein HDE_09317 [Halotydeus destructor]|nr:hypothetical protein HDE_09317 [Halotydeus destructor]
MAESCTWEIGLILDEEIRDGAIHYLVRWSDISSGELFDEEDNTWDSVDCLKASFSNFPEALAAYKQLKLDREAVQDDVSNSPVDVNEDEQMNTDEEDKQEDELEEIAIDEDIATEGEEGEEGDENKKEQVEFESEELEEADEESAQPEEPDSRLDNNTSLKKTAFVKPMLAESANDQNVESLSDGDATLDTEECYDNLEVDKLLGTVKSYKGSTERHWLVVWKNGGHSLVPSKYANEHFPQVVIAFYEAQLKFNPGKQTVS